MRGVRALPRPNAVLLRRRSEASVAGIAACPAHTAAHLLPGAHEVREVRAARACIARQHGGGAKAHAQCDTQMVQPTQCLHREAGAQPFCCPSLPLASYCSPSVNTTLHPAHRSASTSRLHVDVPQRRLPPRPTRWSASPLAHATRCLRRAIFDFAWESSGCHFHCTVARCVASSTPGVARTRAIPLHRTGRGLLTDH